MKLRFGRITDITKEKLQAYMNGLPAARQKELAAMTTEKGRLQSLMGEWLVRSMLAEETGIEMSRYIIVREPGKKPYLKGSEYEFSISHSGEYAMAVIAKHPVGADLERVGRDASKALRRICSASDWNYIERGSNQAAFGDTGQTQDECSGRLTRMTEIWTRKEALVKCLGTGIFDPGMRETVGTGQRELVLNGMSCRLQNVLGPAGYCCAVCERMGG